jgi:ubiquitin carboxyl-terminal hydrolase L3
MLLLNTLQSGGGIFECADTFLEHLQRLKEARPDRFRNTEHRTMTIFWLYHLQLAVLNFKADKRLERWPGPELFHEVLIHSPYLMYSSLWKGYYTKDLMMSPEAKQYWRLPDLQALPDFAEKTQTQKRHLRRLSQEEPYRLMRFAFAVVQKYLSSNSRRGWLVKQSLAALQTTTMRLRAKNPSLPPYSETRAYFWIQLVHAALASLKDSAIEAALAKVPLERLSFSSFRALFDMDPNMWREYYTPKTWDSIEARMAFLPPDLKPLPNVISIPSAGNVLQALDKQIDSARIGMAAEIPSMEELAMRSTLLLDELASMSEVQLSSPDIVGHPHLLRYLFDNLVAKSDNEAFPAATRATSAMMQMSGSYLRSFTLKAFWVQQLLGASSKTDATSTFEDFIKANLHLVYVDLPLCYYSPELLQSLEANETIVQPDRRKLKGYLPITGSLMEDEWVVV